MRILYAGTVDIGREEGRTTHFLGLARALKARGHELVMVARGRRACGKLNDLKVYSVPAVPVPKVATLLSDLLLFLMLVRLTALDRFDVLYQRDIPLANRWARILGLSSVVEINSIYVDDLRAWGKSGWKVRPFKYREMQILSHASRIICVAEGIRDQLVSRYAVRHDQCIIVPNGTDTELFRPQPKSECQRQFGLKSEDYNVGFVGAFQPWVDFECLLEATAYLRSQDVPMRLILVGDGLEYEEVKQQVRQRGLTESVLLTGRVSHKMVPRWIGAFDVCIAPFVGMRNESVGLSPLKLFEYMACARPVIATALPDIIDAVETARAGHLYDVGNTNMLIQHLLSLYRDVDLRDAMGARGRECVVKHHSWDNVAERIETVISELLADRARDSGQEG